MSLTALLPAVVALSKTDADLNKDRGHERTGSSGLVVGVASIAIGVEIIFIILRFVNVGIVNYKIRWFLTVVRVCVCVRARVCVCVYSRPSIIRTAMSSTVQESCRISEYLVK